MNRFLCATVTYGVAILWAGQAWGLPPILRDISQQSPSKQYEVEAKSPDKLPDHDLDIVSQSFLGASRSNFVYTCSDSRGEKVVWIRKQPTKGEGPPIGLFVSDRGWTLIRTYGDEIICVDPKGADRGTVDVIREFTAEYFSYVHFTTSGFHWGHYSLWYFLEADGRNLFVVRPWWGRRVVIDLAAGRVVESSTAIAKAIAAHERDYVISELATAIKTRAEWEGEFADRRAHRFLTAALLAGQLKIAEAAPDLTKLQDSWYLGSSTFGSLHEEFDNEVDHRTYSTFTMRQLAQLSLRRLGHAPECAPVLWFSRRFKDHERNKLYEPKVHQTPRHTRIDLVQKGIRAEEVLDIIGFPDFVGRDGTWEYDMDSKPAQTPILKWADRRVGAVDKKVPALWQKDLVRDELLAY